MSVTTNYQLKYFYLGAGIVTYLATKENSRGILDSFLLLTSHRASLIFLQVCMIFYSLIVQISACFF